MQRDYKSRRANLTELFVFLFAGLQIRNSLKRDYQPMADEIASLSYKSR